MDKGLESGTIALGDSTSWFGSPDSGMGRRCGVVWLTREADREVEMPPEWGGKVPSEVFLDEARRVVDAAERTGLTLR